MKPAHFDFLYSFFHLLGIFIFKILFYMEVEGRENIPEEGPFILASNHLSFLDPPLLGISSPRKLYFLARKTLFKNKIFSAFIKRLGAIPIEREGSPMALRKGLDVLKEGKGLVIFPEGTRSRDGKLKNGKPGVGFLAIKGKCPVVPVFISGTDKALPVGAKFIKPTKIKVKIGKPLLFHDEDYISSTEKIMDSIKGLR